MPAALNQFDSNSAVVAAAEVRGVNHFNCDTSWPCGLSLTEENCIRMRLQWFQYTVRTHWRQSLLFEDAALDRQGGVQQGARLVARYLTIGHPVHGLLATLAHAVLREDAGFHTYQMLEAAWRQSQEWGNVAEAHHILIAAARYIAAHAPTARAQLQTAMVARRLSRGLSVHEAGSESSL